MASRNARSASRPPPGDQATWITVKERALSNPYIILSMFCSSLAVIMSFVSTAVLGSEEAVMGISVKYLTARVGHHARRRRGPSQGALLKNGTASTAASASNTASVYSPGHLCGLAGAFSLPQFLFVTILIICHLRRPAVWSRFAVVASALACELLVLLPWHATGAWLFGGYAVQYQLAACSLANCDDPSLLSIYCFLEVETDCAFIGVTCILLVVGSSFTLISVALGGAGLGRRIVAISQADADLKSRLRSRHRDGVGDTETDALLHS